MHEAYITQIKELRKHSNADRLQVATIFGNNVIVDLSYKVGDIGIYFETGLQLSEEFCKANNLCKAKDEDGNDVGGYLDPKKRNITALKLRKEQSDGLFLPLKSLESFGDISTLKVGDALQTFNGHEICDKYIPKGKQHKQGENKDSSGRPTKKKELREKFPLFLEHVDTEQLMYHLNDFRVGDIVTISLKLDGTSARVSNTLEIDKEFTPLRKLFHMKPKINKHWGYVAGSRRVTLDFENIPTVEDGWYGTNDFRKKWFDIIAPKLHKGETVYGEIVGYVDKNTLIQPERNNKATKDKEFIKQYGSTTRFTYGLNEGENDFYIYRITKTDEDGNIVELPTSECQYRAEQMGIKFAPILNQFIYTTEEDLVERVNKYCDGVDPIGKNHIREGCVVRIENRHIFKAYKHKNFYYKMIAGIISQEALEKMTEEQLQEV